MSLEGRFSGKRQGGTLGVRLSAGQRGWLRRRARAKRSSESDEVRHLIEQAMAAECKCPPLLDRIRSLSAKVPPEAWNVLPPDLTDHLDHYLYGTPKE